MLLREILGLSALLLALAVTALALAGWGRLTVRCLGLQVPDSAGTIQVWLGFAVVVELVEILHLFLPIDWRLTAALATVGAAGVAPQLRATGVILAGVCRRYPAAALLAALVLAIWCARAMAPPDITDSGLYHFSTIQWANRYPIVPGLGNLHGRLAFNQSYFGFVALLNLAPWWGKGYAAGGVFVLCLAMASVLESGLWSRRGGWWVVGTLGVTLGFWAHFDSSPLPDLPVAALQIVIFLLLVRLLDRDAPAPMEGLTLLFLCLVLVTVKLSGVMFAFAALVIALSALRQAYAARRIAASAALAMCVVFTLVHAARGYILSGAPFYPSTVAGAWQLDWAVPIETARSEAAWVYSWARHPGLPPEQVLGNWHWLVPWLRAFPLRGWLDFGIAVLLALAAFGLPRRAALADADRRLGLLYVPSLGAVLFWFFTAPDLRFLGAVPELLVALSGWLMLLRLPQRAGAPSLRLPARAALAAGVALAMMALPAVKPLSFTGWREIPLISAPAVRTTAAGLQVLVPGSDGLCWDAPQPCTPYFDPRLRQRGGSVAGEFSAGFSTAAGPR